MRRVKLVIYAYKSGNIMNFVKQNSNVCDETSGATCRLRKMTIATNEIVGDLVLQWHLASYKCINLLSDLYYTIFRIFFFYKKAGLKQ